VRHVGQDAGVAKKAGQTEVIQNRPKPTSGKCETDFHGSVCAAGRSDSQPSLGGLLYVYLFRGPPGSAYLPIAF
jgi:hypothetical protein